MNLKTIAATLRGLRRRIERNVPSHHDPEKFHYEKRDITDAMQAIVNDIERGNRGRKTEFNAR